MITTIVIVVTLMRGVFFIFFILCDILWLGITIWFLFCLSFINRSIIIKIRTFQESLKFHIILTLYYLIFINYRNIFVIDFLRWNTLYLEIISRILYGLIWWLIHFIDCIQIFSQLFTNLTVRTILDNRLW